MKVETLDFLKMLGRMIRAGSKRVGNADEHELAAFYALKQEMDLQLDQAIASQLADGKTWADIGTALNMSRQGAFRRFSK